MEHTMLVSAMYGPDTVPITVKTSFKRNISRTYMKMDQIKVMMDVANISATM